MLKGYINGTERTNFHYLSAIDQFRKQFTHLEENVGKFGLVPPLERKHESLPRCTIAYPPAIPSRELGNLISLQDRQVMGEAGKKPMQLEAMPCNSLRASLLLQRNSIVNPGRVAGPRMHFENGTTSCAYDPKKFMRNAAFPPQHLHAHSYYSQCKLEKHREKNAVKGEREMVVQQQLPQQLLPSEMAPEICIDMRDPPFCMLGGATNGAGGGGQMVVDTNMLLRAKSDFGGIAAAAGTHAKVRPAQFGISRMY